MVALSRLRPNGAYATTRIILLAIVTSFVLSVGFLVGVANEFNRHSLEREIGLVQSGLRAQHENLKRLAVDYSWWNSAIENLIFAPDAAWADANIGSWMTEAHDVRFVVVVSADDRASLAFIDGKETVLGDDSGTLLSLKYLVGQARDSAGDSPGTASAVLRLDDGRPAIVAVATFMPDDEGRMSAPLTGMPALVVGKIFNDALLQTLGDEILVKNLRLQPPQSAAGEASVPIADGYGRLLGRLDWDAQTPASTFLRSLAPALVGSIFALCVLIALVVVRTRSLTASNARLRQEIDRREALEANLRAAKVAAEDAHRAKSEFLANMSHELRTPLNAIIGFADMILHAEMFQFSKEKQAGYVKDIHASGYLLLEIINDILDLAKIDTGGVQPQEAAIELASVIPAATRLVEARAAKGRVKLAIDVAEDLPPLWADERLVKQILLNLLSNAVKFTPPKGIITVRATCEDGAVTLLVRDTGIGIPADKIPVVLQPFGQVDSALSRKHNGTGLGLPISKRFAELHGATFSLESEVDRGTTVTIRFPRDRTRARQAAILPAA
jgi:signal transduction histidine kinase